MELKNDKMGMAILATLKELLFNHPHCFRESIADKPPKKTMMLLAVTVLISDYDAKEAAKLIVEAYEQGLADFIAKAKKDLVKLEEKINNGAA